jgi:hypothetical protein
MSGVTTEQDDGEAAQPIVREPVDSRWRECYVQFRLARALLRAVLMRGAMYEFAMASIAFGAGAARADANNPRETRVSGDAARALLSAEFGRALSLSEEAILSA